MYICIMTKFKIFASVFRFILYTGVSGAIDHYLGITKFLIYIIEKIIGNFYIMNDLLASWIIIIWFGLIITFIFDKIGFNKWVYFCFKKVKTVTQPIKSQQHDHSSFRKYVNSVLRNIKKFQKRQK